MGSDRSNRDEHPSSIPLAMRLSWWMLGALMVLLILLVVLLIWVAARPPGDLPSVQSRVQGSGFRVQ